MRPNYLKENDTISLIAPSLGCTQDDSIKKLNQSIKTFKKLGYKIVIGNNVYKNDGIISSNHPIERANEFMESYLSDTNIVWSVGGGEFMSEILRYIDFEKIKNAKPKWFIGYSDNTCLTYTLTTLCNIETIYGLNFPAMFNLKSQEVKNMMRILKGEKQFIGYPYYESIYVTKSSPLDDLVYDKNKVIIPYNYKEPFEGTLIGGCIDVLQCLCGTKFDNTKNYTTNSDGIIFFFENYDLSALSLRRTLIQLRDAGWFNNIKGFIIGRSFLQEKCFTELPEKSYIDILKEYNVPILLNCDIGHLHPTLPIMCGSKAKITYQNNNIKIKYL